MLNCLNVNDQTRFRYMFKWMHGEWLRYKQQHTSHVWSYICAWSCWFSSWCWPDNIRNYHIWFNVTYESPSPLTRPHWQGIPILILLHCTRGPQVRRTVPNTICHQHFYFERDWQRCRSPDLQGLGLTVKGRSSRLASWPIPVSSQSVCRM